MRGERSEPRSAARRARNATDLDIGTKNYLSSPNVRKCRKLGGAYISAPRVLEVLRQGGAELRFHLLRILAMEILITGFYDENNDVILAIPDKKVPNGARLA